MEELEVIEEKQDIVINYNNSELDELFHKYFKTIEEQEKEKQLEIKKNEEQQSTYFSSTEEFQTELITEIRELKEFQQYTNNFIYFSIVIVGVILVSCLMYRFLKIFM